MNGGQFKPSMCFTSVLDCHTYDVHYTRSQNYKKKEGGWQTWNIDSGITYVKCIVTMCYDTTW